MSELPSFITIHGIDGTGKTTLVGAIQDVLEANHLDIASSATHSAAEDPWQTHRADFSELSGAERVFYKLGSKAAQGRLIAQRKDSGITTVKDRWTIDVLADETHKGTVIPTGILSTILQPDMAVLLVCDEEARMARITSRPDPTPEDLVPRTPGSRAYYFQDYLTTHLPASAAKHMQLNSTNTSPKVLAESVVERIYGL